MEGGRKLIGERREIGCEGDGEVRKRTEEARNEKKEK